MDKSNIINTLEATDCSVYTFGKTFTQMPDPHPSSTLSSIMSYKIETEVLFLIYFPKPYYLSKKHILFQKEKLSWIERIGSS